MPAPESEMTAMAVKAAKSLPSMGAVTRQEIYEVMLALVAAARAAENEAIAKMFDRENWPVEGSAYQFKMELKPREAAAAIRSRLSTIAKEE